MGYNSTVVVMNDALSAIASDPEFGAKLESAILKMSILPRGFRVAVSASSSFGIHGNAAVVVSSLHADETALIATGGNYGQLIGSSLNDPYTSVSEQIALLETVLALLRAKEIS